MKRCPLCDFIYEDEQGVCDMDGIELVHEGGSLVHVGRETTLKLPTSAPSPRRRRSLQLLLGFGMGAAVISAFYSSINQAAPVGGKQTSSSYTARPAPPVVEATPELNAPPLPIPTAEAPTPISKETTPTPAPEPRAAVTNRKKSPRGGGSKKKESKLSSILNKTGRVLKKPFGF
jgi:hypothetical protein